MNTPKEKISVPIELLSLVRNMIDTHPSVLETEYYASESLSTLMQKGKLIWYKYGLSGKTLDKQEGLIEYSKNAIYIYFKKRDNESSYKYFVLSNSDSLDSIIFLFHNLQKLITI
jgi:hypothetical protein